ncbi:hypothetical protein U5640_16780 [Streptomyces sp. SS7]|uniref:hypothetical protein n=1 Tax=Streptomyces sp. SS7 TaxID=3108485 RepID=UPI0030EE0612
MTDRPISEPKRGRRWTKSIRDGVLFETDVGFMLQEIQHGGKYRELAAYHAAKIAAQIIKAAPRGPHKFTDEYSIKKNIHANVERNVSGWIGYVTIEENPKARHALLQERGYRTRDGKRHAGRFYIKGVLERQRVE